MTGFDRKVCRGDDATVALQLVVGSTGLLLDRSCRSTTLSTADELATLPAESGNLAARHNLVKIAEACWGEAKYLNWMAVNHASVQPVEVACWKEADACTMDGISNCYGSC